MKTSKLIYELGMRRSKNAIIKKYGKEFYRDFNCIALKGVSQVVAQMPDIGNTMFAFNYAFAPTYIAWYKACKALELTHEETRDMLWLVNERLIGFEFLIERSGAALDDVFLGRL